MEEQVFTDGIGTISVIGGTVRLDFIAYSPTEKDPSGQPLAVFRQRIIMGTDTFLHSAEKMHEAAQALAARIGRSTPAPVEPSPKPAPQSQSSQTSTQPEPTPTQKPPFP